MRGLAALHILHFCLHPDKRSNVDAWTNEAFSNRPSDTADNARGGPASALEAQMAEVFG